MGLSSRLVLLMLSRSCLVTHVLKFYLHKKLHLSLNAFDSIPFSSAFLAAVVSREAEALEVEEDLAARGTRARR